MGNKVSKPKHLIVLKIAGFIGIIVAIVGGVLSFKGFGDFESNNFMIGGIMTSVGLFAGIFCLIFGFRPEIAKIGTKTAKYIQNQNKEDLKEMSTTSAEIKEEAVTKTVKAVKKGLQDSKFCKECGKEIDSDAKFCEHCGTKQ